MNQRIECQPEDHLQSLTKTLDAKLDEVSMKTKSLVSVHKVPEVLRKLKESAYIPRLIAIGPLHRNDEHLKTMQYIKISYTNDLLLRLTKGVTDPELAKQKRSSVLKECVKEMNRSIDDAKKCYPEEVGNGIDEEMLFLDGCFIIELLYRCSKEKKATHGGDGGNSKASSKTEPPPEVPKNRSMVDPIFDSMLTAMTVQLDLLLLENQIPFFVLEKLFHLTIDKIPNHRNKKTLNGLYDVYFHNMMNILQNNSTAEGSTITTSCDSPSDHVLWVTTGNKYYHILHKLHSDYLPFDLHQTRKTRFKVMPSASNLDYAGIKFVPGTEKNIFSIKFIEPQGPFWWCHRAHFEIPTLEIYDLTEAFLRNIIAFEQCCPGVSQHFTSYAYLMDMLVNSDKDVERLEKSGVMCNFLGASEDATNLFNKLCKETILAEFFFADTCNKATEYSKHCWPKNMTRLRRTYFGSPWTFIAFCVGFIAFVMSVIQFIHNFLK